MGGHFGKFWRKSEARILMMGLDAAGKTTILYQLKLGEVVTTIPTIGFNVETIEHKNFQLTAWDVGGRDKMRPLFRHYFQNTQAIIYVVDSNDVERMDQLREEIHRNLEEDELRDTVLLVLANKQDLPNAKSAMFLVEKLELHKIRHKWHIIPAVATKGDGLKESLDWIVSAMTDKSTAVGAGKVPPPEQTTSSEAAVGYFGKVWELIKSVFVETNDSVMLAPPEGVK